MYIYIYIMTSHYSTFSVAMGNHLIPSSGSPDPQYHAGRTDVTAEVGDPWIQNVTLGSWILPTCSWPPTICAPSRTSSHPWVSSKNSALGWRMAYSAKPRPHMFISSLQIIERRRLKSTSIISEASNGAKWHCFGVNFSPSFCFSSLRSLASSLCSFWLSLANKSAGSGKKSLVFVPLLLLGDLLPTIQWLCQP